jgi:hypothetical protein
MFIVIKFHNLITAAYFIALYNLHTFYLLDKDGHRTALLYPSGNSSVAVLFFGVLNCQCSFQQYLYFYTQTYSVNSEEPG